MDRLDHESIVADWQANAKKHDEENFTFLRQVKRSGSGIDLDEVGPQLHEEIFKVVDCKRCANCCKVLDVNLTHEDIERIAAHLGMTTEEFTVAYLEPHEHKEEMTIRKKPCPFLGPDNLCTIYEVRPACCREYPHTDKHDYTGSTISRANSALVCPAAFWIVEELRLRADR